jgi:coenzyme F420 hydrogenase subunit beta
MKLAEAVLNLRRERPRRLARMMPAHAWALVAPYGLAPRAGELPAAGATTSAARSSPATNGDTGWRDER